MEYYNNIFCISKPLLTNGDPASGNIKDKPVLTSAAYDHLVNRYPHIRVRKGGGVGCPALLNYEMLRQDLKDRLHEKYGDIRQASRRNRLQELIQPDHKAAKYFSEFLFDDESGIKPERQQEYNANATILNAIGTFVNEKQGKNKRLGGRTSGIWQAASEAVNALDRSLFPHTLPSNALRLKEKYRNYLDHGYYHLIHKGNKNDNARKMNAAVERLILSIYCMENLPFGTWVHDHYMEFLSGNRIIVDKESGVMFDREEYFDDRRGTYIIISQSSVWNILNKPENAIIIDRLRNNRIDHVTQKTPFNHRHLPQYSLSKISMDDRTLSRKTSDGKWLNVYLAVDVLSGCFLSCVHSSDSPTVGMIWNCFREMLHTINDHNLVWPGEVEVENHLMKDIEEELRKMFAYVTFCAPGLSRSKRAEHVIRSKKYGDEKMHQVGIGRWNLKGAYKTKSENKDEDYKQPRIPIEQLIAEDKESIQRHNNDLHPNQKMFPGKTRWQVLVENMNPDLSRPQKHKLLRYLGHRTETSIRNNDFAQVQYEKYSIDNLSAITRLKPHNYNVEAFYVPDASGNIDEVFLYQGDTFITKATKIEKYNEAKIERTERDEQIRTDQAKRQAHFFKTERDGIAEKITRKIDMIPAEQLLPQVQNVEIIPEPAGRDENQDLDDLIKQYEGWGTKQAIERL